MEAFTRPYKTQCFFLGLAVALLDACECAACVAYDSFLVVLLLNQDCTEADWACIRNDFGWRVFLEVRQFGCSCKLLLELVERLLLLRFPGEG